MNTSKLIGIFATEISSRIQGELYTQLHKKATECGYHLILFSGTYTTSGSNTTTSITRGLYELAEQMELAAMIIHVQAIRNEELIRSLIDLGQKKRIPIIAYDCNAMGLTSNDGVITVNLDYKQGFAESVKHIIEYHHCRNIFLLAGEKGNQYSDDREEVFREQMNLHQIPFREEQIGYGHFWENPAIEAVNHFLDSGLPAPEAICCANDTMAITAAKVLRKRGLRVPEDVLVTGFDGIEEGKYNYPSIATCEPSMEEAAEFIFRVITGQDDSDSFLIPFQYYPKESCGCNSENTLDDKREISRLVENNRVSSWQHHMMTTMQFSLIDSGHLEHIGAYMNGILDLFQGYRHLFCIRDQIEWTEDYTSRLDQMVVFLNKDFLPNANQKPYPAEAIFPDFNRLVSKAEDGDLFMMRLLHNGDALYGYDIVQTDRYSSNDLKLLGQLAESLTLVIESILRNKRLEQATSKLSDMYEQMSEIYNRDTMTGMYNRYGYYLGLEDYMKRDELQNGFVHIISIDMDGMKHINDQYGHHEGDHAIKLVAKAIGECFSQPYVSARFGGDEFVVALFTEQTNPSLEKITIKLNSFLETLAEDREYDVQVSVGQAVSKLSEIPNIETMEKIADQYMYDEKRKRKNGQ